MNVYVLDITPCIYTAIYVCAYFKLILKFLHLDIYKSNAVILRTQIEYKLNFEKSKSYF